MRLGKMATVAMMVLAVMVPATATAQASAGCAPTQQSRWVGDYTGTHTLHEVFGGGTHPLDIEIFVQSGQFRTLYQGYSIPATVDGGYVRTDSMGNTAYAANTATCDTTGAVETFGGTWSYQYDPFCWSCVVYGDFEMSRA